MGIGDDKHQITPELDEAIQAVLEKRLSEIYTAIPAQIVSYDAKKNLSKVQPTLNIKYVDEEESQERPVISGVRVQFQKMGEAWLRLPVAPGQEGLLVFAMRSIDIWQALGGNVDPEDNRKFSINDAFFIPGATSDDNSLSPKGNPNNLELVNDKMVIEMAGGGKISVRNSQASLLTIIFNLITILEAEPFVFNKAGLAAEKLLLQSMKL